MFKFNMKKEKTVEKKYNRFSIVYDILEWPVEKLLLGRWRKRIIGAAKGKILEVGAGTGKNLPYYSKKAKVTGIDISKGMLEKAVKKSKKLRLDCRLLLMDAEHIKFGNNSFDTVLCTFILCSVPDPAKALKEMRRVCKPNGRIIMVEHVLSKNRIIALWQKLHNPITKWLVGVNINRDTIANIRKAGLDIVSEENLAVKDVFKYIVCSPNKNEGKT